ncbi:MAG: tetratricopeptide repeat protein [Rhizobacter sp.]|nr:tetratricopeptide repeat protein [Rhizobacter sp.]
MRFADLSLRASWLLVLGGALVAGCASTPLPPAEPPPEAAPAKAMPAAPAAPAVPASGVAKGPAPVAEPEVPVPPAAQRTFDDARRALRAGRMNDAERGFRSLAQVYPELGGPHANLGLIYRQAGKLPEAAAEFELATKASPRQPVYFNQLGITYRLQGQFDKARSAYERALELDPNYAAAVLNLGILSDLYLWDAGRALALYERYLALTPAGDTMVTKWVADLKNRKPAKAAAATAPRKEKE